LLFWDASRQATHPEMPNPISSPGRARASPRQSAPLPACSKSLYDLAFPHLLSAPFPRPPVDDEDSSPGWTALEPIFCLDLVRPFRAARLKARALRRAPANMDAFGGVGRGRRHGFELACGGKPKAKQQLAEEDDAWHGARLAKLAHNWSLSRFPFCMPGPGKRPACAARLMHADHALPCLMSRRPVCVWVCGCIRTACAIH